MNRKKPTPKLKSKVAIEAIIGYKTVNELSKEFGFHEATIRTWKKQLMEGSIDIFSKKWKKETRNHEVNKDKSSAQMDILKQEVDWLKQKTDYLSEKNLKLIQELEKAYNSNPFYNIRKLINYLKGHKYIVNCKCVQRLKKLISFQSVT